MAVETIPASHRDLLDAEVATLATVGANGRPQQSILHLGPATSGQSVKSSTPHTSVAQASACR